MNTKRRPEPPEDCSQNGNSCHPLVTAFNEYRDDLVSTLLYMLGNKEDAHDAAQEAFLKCWRAREKIGTIQNLRAWIFRICLNTARDMRRSAWSRRVKPLIAEESMLAARSISPEASAEDNETLARLQEAICNLRDEEKEVFLLRQNGDLTYEQIAEMRHTPVGTIKTQMRTALIKLRAVLNPATISEEN